MVTFLFVMAILGMMALPFVHVRYLESAKKVPVRQARQHSELFGFVYALLIGVSLQAMLFN
ncbi:MAG: hypothetical protein ACO2Z5_01470 [Burkholderiaceae bacterium]|jgi:hypothetical protein